MEKGRRLLGKVGGGSILLTKGRAILFILGSLLVSRGGEGVLKLIRAGGSGDTMPTIAPTVRRVWAVSVFLAGIARKSQFNSLVNPQACRLLWKCYGKIHASARIAYINLVPRAFLINNNSCVCPLTVNKYKPMTNFAQVITVLNDGPQFEFFFL